MLDNLLSAIHTSINELSQTDSQPSDNHILFQQVYNTRNEMLPLSQQHSEWYDHVTYFQHYMTC